jgi:hypothetical protein
MIFMGLHCIDGFAQQGWSWALGREKPKAESKPKESQNPHPGADAYMV